MKTFIFRRVCFIAVMVFSFFIKSMAQCGGGLTQGTLNWSFQYKASAFINPTRFAIGTNSMQLGWNGSVATVANPANGTFQGFGAGGYGDGASLQMNPSSGGVITLIFNDEVSTLRFAIYDIDESQTVNVTATNASASAVPVTMALSNPSAIVSVAGSGTNSATATALSAANQSTGAGNTNTGVNIDITGQVKTVTLTFGVNTSNIFISDILTCNTNAFPNSYFLAATPEIGQSAFVTANDGLNVYAVDLATKIATRLFTANAGGASAINSLAYDPYNAFFYYTDAANIGSNRAIYRYNMRTCTESIWIADVTTFASSGVTLPASLGVGAAAFYDGAYYFGAEAASGAANSNVTIWKVNTDGLGTPLFISRSWSRPGTDGAGAKLYDWGDFAINDGILYNFTSGSAADINHFNLNTQANVATFSIPNVVRQSGLDHSGNIYSIATGVALYNGNGTFGTVTPISGGGWPSGAAADDGSGPFKWPSDYGDAPASYGKAFHEMRICASGGPSSGIRLGATEDYESLDNPSNTATGDDIANYTGSGTTDDEDGLANFFYDANTFTATIIATSPSTATLSGWFDTNGNGIFDVGERQQITVTAGTANYILSWPIAATPVTGGGTFNLRFRISATAAEVTNPTGRATSGEVEDYQIVFGVLLPITINDFSITNQGCSATLKWKTSSEQNSKRFNIEHSTDGNYFVTIGEVTAAGTSDTEKSYLFPVTLSLATTNYYRLRMLDIDGKSRQTNIISANCSNSLPLNIYPNPVTGGELVSITGLNTGMFVEVMNMQGQVLTKRSSQGSAITLNTEQLSKGVYIVRVSASNGQVKILRLVKQ